MLIKISDNYDIDSAIKLLKGHGFSDVKKVCWQDEFIDSEISYRVENDSEGYSKDTIIQASSSFREELEANLDDTAIDNDYLGRRWVTLLDMFDDKN